MNEIGELPGSAQKIMLLAINGLKNQEFAKVENRVKEKKIKTILSGVCVIKQL